MKEHYGHGTPAVTPMDDMEHKPFSLGVLKGRWTLLYFWADWCVPCIKEGIPALITFAKEHAAEKDKYRIVAIRFNSMDEAGDWGTFKTTTAHLEKTLWHEVPPFPLVYDSSTRMSTDWGIHALPTYALINPRGNLVPEGDLSKLKAGLGL